jgi:hypothetical protein
MALARISSAQCISGDSRLQLLVILYMLVRAQQCAAICIVQMLRACMPPVVLIEDDPAVLAQAVANAPASLCSTPLPPAIVTEKGESLADFMHRAAPDFFTSLQVRFAAHCTILKESAI